MINEKPDWLRDPSDLTVTPEDIASAERYYRVTMHRSGIAPSAAQTKLTPIPIAQLHDDAMRLASEWVEKRTIASVIAHFRAEIAYTFFCSRHKRGHPSKDPVDKRLKGLWWIVEYLE